MLAASKSEVQAEAGVEFAAAEPGEGKSAAVEFAGEPFAGESEVEERGAERAAEVGAALTPVETGVGKATAARAGAVKIEAEGGEGAGTFRGQVIRIAATVAVDPAGAKELIMEGDGDGAGHVVIAGASGAEVGGGAGDKPGRGPPARTLRRSRARATLGPARE